MVTRLLTEAWERVDQKFWKFCCQNVWGNVLESKVGHRSGMAVAWIWSTSLSTDLLSCFSFQPIQETVITWTELSMVFVFQFQTPSGYSDTPQLIKSGIFSWSRFRPIVPWTFQKEPCLKKKNWNRGNSQPHGNSNPASMARASEIFMPNMARS